MRDKVPDLAAILKRHTYLADFGELALRSAALAEVFDHACRLAVDVVGANRVTIFEVDKRANILVVKASRGWEPTIVDGLVVAIGERSPERYTIEHGKPVVSNDVRRDDRFEVDEFIQHADTVALVSVPIFLPDNKLYGIFRTEVLATERFDDHDVEILRISATMLGSLIDRLIKLDQAAIATEPFRRVVDSVRDYAIFSSDADDLVTDWLPGAEAVFGWAPDEILGQSASMLFTPEDVARGEDQKELKIARATGSAPNVRWHIRKDGSRIFIEGSVRALYDAAGNVTAFLKIGQDVTERRQREKQLRESEARSQQFGEASSDVLWVRNAETMQFEYLSPAFETIYQETLEAVLSAPDNLQSWGNLLHPDDRDKAISTMKGVRDGAVIRHEFRIIRPSDGQIRWIEDSDFPLFNDQGDVERFGGIAKDVTQSKANTARLEVLLGELQHRGRNLLGVVSSLAASTMEKGGSVEDFQARLKALGRAQALLSHFGSDTVEVGALVRAELKAHTDLLSPNVIISGPEIHLTAPQVQNYALALHELATNAVKYGALRFSMAKLSVTWSEVTRQQGQRHLALDWIESGVHIVPGNAARRGSGRELIEESLSYAMGARTAFVIGADGVQCRIELPLYDSGQ